MLRKEKESTSANKKASLKEKEEERSHSDEEVIVESGSEWYYPPGHELLAKQGSGRADKNKYGQKLQAMKVLNEMLSKKNEEKEQIQHSEMADKKKESKVSQITQLEMNC
ncbi:glycophorin-binding protein precursor [Reticulomyxa filosa]|uniref:Glycophorin-binding protein n=1 Tax=Reticulomyxa filosa TaxID=46433 RepID=X6PDW0_RETFI|nr:glycophorin-binding protein precursor [Reticulomyxa filosa]|eukprot:ETO36700.1 glycophorin-binding protein precursor [Reticulomyxa filosa]